jgi:hypothetical protein
MEPLQASKALGFTARVPTNLPDRWMRAVASLHTYPVPSTHSTVETYIQIWAPPGERIDAPGTCSTRLLVKQRRLQPGESADPSWVGRIRLDDGSEVTGQIRSSTCGSAGGEIGESGDVHWTSGGVVTTVTSWGIPREVVLKIIDSLRP